MASLKNTHNDQARTKLHYLLENNGVVVDLILDNRSQILPFEIKSVQTYYSDFRQNLKKFLSYANLADGCIVYHGKLGQ